VKAGEKAIRNKVKPVSQGMGQAMLPVSSSFISIVFSALTAYVVIIKKKVLIYKKNTLH